MAEKVARRKPRFWLEKNGAMTHTDCLWAESCFRKASFRPVIVVCATALNWSGTCRQAEPGFPTGDCCLQAESSSRKDPWGILLRSNPWSCGAPPFMVLPFRVCTFPERTGQRLGVAFLKVWVFSRNGLHSSYDLRSRSLCKNRVRRSSRWPQWAVTRRAVLDDCACEAVSAWQHSDVAVPAKKAHCFHSFSSSSCCCLMYLSVSASASSSLILTVVI